MTNIIMAQDNPHFQEQKYCNLDIAKSFLATLTEDENFTFQTFDDNQKRKDPSLVRVLHGSLEEHKSKLIELNQKGAGIFFTVNKTDLKVKWTPKSRPKFHQDM